MSLPERQHGASMPSVTRTCGTVILLLLVRLGVSYVYKALKRYRKPIDVPVLGLDGHRYEKAKQKFISDLPSIVAEGYKKYRHEVYQIFTPAGYQSVLPSEFVRELMSLPDDVLTTTNSFDDAFVGGSNHEYGGLNIKFDLGIYLLRKDFTNQLEMLLPGICEELERIVPTVFVTGDDWKPFKLCLEFPRILNGVIGRMFFGPVLSRDEDWLKISRDGETDFYAVAYAIASWTAFLRPLVGRLLPRAHRLLQNYAAAKRMLIPIMQERAQAEATMLKDYVPPNDFTQRLLEVSRLQDPPVSYERQSELLLTISTDAIFALNWAMSQTMFDLAARPEYVQPLRDEIREVVDGPTTNLDKEKLRRLVKLDSFIKESQRLSPPAILSFERKVMSPITLSNGLVLPPGLRITVPTASSLSDAHLWESPEVFQGFRFVKLRQMSPENSQSYQYMGSADDYMIFGKGRHMCPARFLVTYVVKTTMVHVLQNFDLELADKTKGRPKNCPNGMMNYPDYSAEILMRRKLQH